MAQITRTDAQAVLVTGAKPQESFWQDLMDSVIFKDEASSLGGSSGTMATQAEAEAGTDNVKVMSPLRTKQSVTKFAIDVLRDGVPTLANTLKKLWDILGSDYTPNDVLADMFNDARDTVALNYYNRTQVDTLLINSNKTFGHIFGYTDVECDGTNFIMTNFGNAIYTSVSGSVNGTASFITLNHPVISGYSYTNQVELLGYDTAHSLQVPHVLHRTHLPTINPTALTLYLDDVEQGTKIRIYQIYN
jgi:hypothetical protein